MRERSKAIPKISEVLASLYWSILISAILVVPIHIAFFKYFLDQSRHTTPNISTALLEFVLIVAGGILFGVPVGILFGLVGVVVGIFSAVLLNNKGTYKYMHWAIAGVLNGIICNYVWFIKPEIIRTLPYPFQFCPLSVSSSLLCCYYLKVIFLKNSAKI